MVRSGNEFSVVQELPRGVHQYKFIVDEQWRFATDQPKTQDGSGNMNNVLDITTYQKFQAGLLQEREPPMTFGQVIPDPNDYTLDAPHLPLVLQKSSYCAVPPRPEVGSGVLPNIQTHLLSDHVYLEDNLDDDIPLIASVTHRYDQKYSTTVFALKGPIGFDLQDTGPNWLQTALA